MSPDVVICSVGKKPDVDAYDDYKGHNADVLSHGIMALLPARFGLMERSGSITRRATALRAYLFWRGSGPAE